MEQTLKLDNSMHKLLPLFILTFVFCVSAGAQKQSDAEKEKLIGPVKSVRSQMMKFSSVEATEPGITKQMDVVVYDTKGNEIERTIYDDYGFLVGRQVQTYDVKRNSMESVLSDEKGSLMGRRVYVYAGPSITHVTSYDAKGSPGMRQVNLYGADGNLLEETYFIANKRAAKTVYKYERGNLSEIAFHLADGSKADATIGPCLGAHRLTYAYDDQARPVKVIAYETDGKFKKSWQYTYDAKGQMREDTRESEWSRINFVYAYEYDSHGNWTKQTATVTTDRKGFDPGTDKSKTVITREIVYH